MTSSIVLQESKSLHHEHSLRHLTSLTMRNRSLKKILNKNGHKVDPWKTQKIVSRREL